MEITHTKGSRAAQLSNKLSNVKRKVINWNKLVFGRVDMDIKKKLAELQKVLDSINSTEDVRKEIMWAQKARRNWILYGDRNTKYFQTVVR